MYGLEIFLGVLYEGLEQKVTELFSAFEARRKGQRVSQGSLIKVTGNKDKGIQELPKLSCSVN